MPKKLFAAICVGSYEVGMKLFELSEHGLPKLIESIRTDIEIGRDSFFTGAVAMKNVDEICRVLRDFLKILDGYKIKDFAAVGTSGFRATSNTDILLDQIRNRTGINVEVLTNSEQRFFEYKSLFVKKEAHVWLASKNTLIAEVGGSSIQLSFLTANAADNDFCLHTSHNLKLGLVRLREMIYRYADNNSTAFESLLEKMIEDALTVFVRIFDHYKKYDNLVVLDGYLSPAMHRENIQTDFERFFEKTNEISAGEISKKYGVSQSRAVMLKIASMVTYRLAKRFGVVNVYFPGTDILDGMAVDFGVRTGRMKLTHNFDDDIYGEVFELCTRFRCDIERNQKLAEVCELIFNALKRVHGLTLRDRMLLRIAALLYDCGCYIGTADAGENAYRVVASAEIIGITRNEKMDIANAIKYSYVFAEDEDFEYAPYPMKAVKLSVIIKLSAALVKNKQAKALKIKVAVQGDELVFYVTATDDMTLERGIFEEEKLYLDRIFGMKPRLRVKISEGF